MKKFHFVYQTVCNANGKSYIGVHSTNDIDDGYIGCGIYRRKRGGKLKKLFQRAVKKYGYDNFTRYIYSFYETREEALEEEKWLVNENWVKRKDNYNCALGGNGCTTFWMNEERKDLRLKKISEGVKDWYKNGGLEKIREAAKKAVRKKRFGSENSAWGKPKPNRRPILQFDKNNNLVERFDYITLAAEKTGFHLNSISKCCVGINKTTMGFVFRYETYSDAELERLNKNLVRKKRVSKFKGVPFSEERKDKISKALLLYNKRKKDANEC